MRRLFVYILECEDKSYYVGVTNNLKRRLQEHNTKMNANAYTAVRLPVRLLHFTTFDDPRKAIAFEKRLKKWTREKKEAYMAGDWEKLKSLSACRNATASFRRSSKGSE
ncbi:MAG: GIY-YIG nuclease family protein [Cyclobacteriaceae bacterium]|nr:GIY-YIG nuclease family protein [Cyclobacteriaceae bacterium]